MKLDFLRTGAAYVAILAGLFLNPWTLRGLMVEDDGTRFWTIVLWQLAAVHFGLLLLSQKSWTRWLKLALALVLIAIPVLALRHLGTLRPAPEAVGPSAVLGRALSLHQRQISTLGSQTAEILYALHSEIDRVEVQVPERGTLDTASGIDPAILQLFEGEVTFEVGAIDAAGDATRLYRKTYPVHPAARASFSWQPVNIDLSRFAGQKIALLFRKTWDAEGGTEKGRVFDLTPPDLMFWREPEVRPVRLTDAKNVILLSIDTLRADHLGFMGYGRDTSPHLDRLAADSVVFTRCFSQAPWTTPSHFSILTGLYPTHHGGNRPQHDMQRFWDDRLPTVATWLTERGYKSGAFTGTAAMSSRFGFYKDFDFYDQNRQDEEGSDIDPIFAKAAHWIRQHQDRSFFLFLHTYEPHWPYTDRHFVEAEGVDENDEWPNLLALYDGDIRRTDAYVGRLLELLEQLGLLEDTLLIVTSDHGEEFDERVDQADWKNHRHGHSLHDEVLHVPLLIHGLGADFAGRRVDAQVRSIDILPTLLEALELALPSAEEPGADRRPLDGRSLFPLLRGEDGTPRPIFSEAPTFGPDRESVRTDEYRYVRRLSYGQLTHPVSDGFPLTPLHELYDLRADPLAKVNLADQQPDLVHELQALIDHLLPGRVLEEGVAGDLQRDAAQDARLADELRALGYL